MKSKAPPVEVALLVLPESFPGALMGLYEILASVGAAWSQVTGEPECARRRFRPVTVSRDGRPVRSPAGPTIHVEASLAELPSPDIVIVTDLAVDPMADALGDWGPEIAWVREASAGGAIVCSVCSGALVLGEAGILDDMEATSHWSVAAAFAARFPRVRLEPQRILCPSGPGHRIVTAGGASSFAELSLYLIARFAGEAEARRMAKLFVLGDKSDGQLPFAAMARPRQHDDPAIAAAQGWIADHYTVDNPVARMAEIAGLAERTFARRFRKATGYGPVAYVQALRLEEAKQLLETTGEPTDEVALAVGYQDPVFFRRLFKREVGVTPAVYRRRFSAVGRHTTA